MTLKNDKKIPEKKLRYFTNTLYNQLYCIYILQVLVTDVDGYYHIHLKIFFLKVPQKVSLIHRLK